MNACAFWRALRAVLSTPFGYKLQTIWAICGRARGFRTQECARSCDMSTNEIFDKIKYFLTSWLSSYLENSLLSLKKASFFGGVEKKNVWPNYQKHTLICFGGEGRARFAYVLKKSKHVLSNHFSFIQENIVSDFSRYSE